MKQINIIDPKPRLISLIDICKLTSLSRTAIQNARQRGEFPLPVQLGPKRIAFVREEIDAWIDARIAARPTS